MLYNLLKSIYRFFATRKRKVLIKYWTWRAKMACGSYDNPLIANFRCDFTKKTMIGKDCHFNGFEVAGTGKVTIGDNFHCGKNCKIINSFHNYEGTTLPYDRTFVIKDVHIGNNVWLGDNVIILGGANIGEGAIIQAGSVVVKDIPKCAIAGGHPATPFKYRNEAHYNKLKAEKKFFK